MSIYNILYKMSEYALISMFHQYGIYDDKYTIEKILRKIKWEGLMKSKIIPHYDLSWITKYYKSDRDEVYLIKITYDLYYISNTQQISLRRRIDELLKPLEDEKGEMYIERIDDLFQDRKDGIVNDKRYIKLKSKIDNTNVYIKSPKLIIFDLRPTILFKVSQ
jgi:hypothetical protein